LPALLLLALRYTLSSLDLLHKSDKGEAFANKNPDLTDKSGRKCFAPTAKNRLLQEVYSISDCWLLAPDNLNETLISDYLLNQTGLAF
jgi:hypothetical protein